MMLTKKISEFLKSREFISVATCDLNGRPNAAPKFLLKIEDNLIYLIDYSFSRTLDNLRINPKVSLSFMDTDNLTGYQINGSVRIIDKGQEYNNILHELRAREINLSVKRIIEGVYREKTHKSFEVAIPENVTVFKVSIEEVVEIGPRGDLKRERLSELK